MYGNDEGETVSVATDKRSGARRHNKLFLVTLKFRLVQS